MKALLLVGLAATLAGCASYESAAYGESAYGPPPDYRYYEPQYYEPQYYEPQYYDPRYCRRYGGYCYPSRRYRTWNGYRHG